MKIRKLQTKSFIALTPGRLDVDGVENLANVGGGINMTTGAGGTRLDDAKS
jgi:hypothetical protein